jgi:glycosyl transferase family 25
MMQIYIIHSGSLPERAIHMQKQMDRIGLPFEWVEEFDASAITPTDDARWFSPDSSLSRAQKSCALKHISAMQRIRDRGHERALILEDDVFLAANFVERLQEMLLELNSWSGPNVLHLGAATNFYTPAENLRKGRMLYAGDRNRNAEAYVIGAKSAGLRLDWIEKHKLTDPIDISYNSTDASMNIGIVWSEPPLAEQGSLNGKFRSSLDPKNRGPLFLKVQFPIQKFRRKYLKRWANDISAKLQFGRPWKSPRVDNQKG